MADHTPLPWTVDPDDRTGYEWNFHIVGVSNPDHRICFMTSDGPSEANAAYMVKACNAYPELMKALEEIEGIIADHERVLLVPNMKEIKKIWNIVRSALALVGRTQHD